MKPQRKIKISLGLSFLRLPLCGKKMGRFCGFAARKKKNQHPQTVSKSAPARNCSPSPPAADCRTVLAVSPAELRPHPISTRANTAKKQLQPNHARPKAQPRLTSRKKLICFCAAKPRFFAPFFAASRQLFFICLRFADNAIN